MSADRDYRVLRDAAARMRDDGIQRGNEGIDVGTWTPPGEPECPTLPGHEHDAGKRRNWEDEA